jgi:hypothetical protein
MTLARYRQEPRGAIGSLSVTVELDPPQPEAVTAALERLLGSDAQNAGDPWWAAGLAASLRSGDGAAAEDPWGGTGVVEP